MKKIPDEKLCEWFSYNEETGILRWEKSPAPHVPVKAMAGNLNPNGYITIKLRGKHYSAHRLAWFLVYGSWPNEIDHINRNRSDNRIENLRDVSRLENCRNGPLFRNNSSGIRGVHWNKSIGKWVAVIVINRKHVFLGTHETILDAAAARKAAEREYDFHPNHGRGLAQ